jgi:hypothetical protein
MIGRLRTAWQVLRGYGAAAAPSVGTITTSDKTLAPGTERQAAKPGLLF